MFAVLRHLELTNTLEMKVYQEWKRNDTQQKKSKEKRGNVEMIQTSVAWEMMELLTRAKVKESKLEGHSRTLEFIASWCG